METPSKSPPKKTVPATTAVATATKVDAFLNAHNRPERSGRKLDNG